MVLRVTFHPGLDRLLRILLFAVVFSVAVAGVVRFSKSRNGVVDVSAPVRDSMAAAGPSLTSQSGSFSLLLPILQLCVASDAPEASWTASLATATSGQAEVSVQNGRIDVLTSEFAIEIDFVAKWHEGIGQAAHYGVATGKRPALALVLRDSDWPVDDAQLTLLRQIDRVCQEQRIKLFLLVPGCP